MKVIIVGGVAGGMSAATRLRRLVEDAEIIVLERGPFVSFANCGLPYYVSGEIKDRNQLLVQTPDALKARFNIDVRPKHEVIEINPENRKVTIEHDGKILIESYDKLILSTGARPIVLPIAGLKEANNVYSLRNVPDLDDIMRNIHNEKPKNAVVIGAGYIGIEMAENLANRGIEVTIVEKAPHVIPALDEEIAVFVKKELEKNGVKVLTNQAANMFKDNGKVIVLEDGTHLYSDLTIMSVGVTPESSIAAAAGLETGMRGGIVVDDKYQTSLPDIFAVGDAIIVKQQISNREALIPLASPANRQGRQVADVIAGLNRKNQGSIGTAIVRAFGITAASTGLSERSALQSGLNIKVVHVSGKDHAGYYPGASNLILKLIFDPETGEIFGAQAAGSNGVDKRIDILSTSIKGKLTIFDLPELELAYAPPFGSAKDPINMLGYAAMNIAEGISESIQWHELQEERTKGKVFLDVRNEGELAAGKFKDAKNIPLNELRNRIKELDVEKEYIVSCHSGLRSYIAERILNQNGIRAVNLDGAFALYSAVRPEELVY